MAEGILSDQNIGIRTSDSQIGVHTEVAFGEFAFGKSKEGLPEEKVEATSPSTCLLSTPFDALVSTKDVGFWLLRYIPSRWFFALVPVSLWAALLGGAWEVRPGRGSRDLGEWLQISGGGGSSARVSSDCLPVWLFRLMAGRGNFSGGDGFGRGFGGGRGRGFGAGGRVRRPTGEGILKEILLTSRQGDRICNKDRGRGDRKSVV